MNISTINRPVRSRPAPSAKGRWLVAAALALVATSACDVHAPYGPGSVASLSISPDASMAIDGTHQFEAEALDADGREVSITPTWSVLSGGGTIDSNGLFTAGTEVGLFAGTIQASSGGMTATANVTVTSGPIVSITVSPDPDTLYTAGTQQFTATAEDAGGNPVAITATWSVTNGGGTISTEGLFTAGMTAGTFTNTVQATSAGGLSGTATVTVVVATPPPPMPGLFGTAAPNGIMAGTEVTCITGGTIDADVSIHPGNTVSGFGPCVITGVQHLGDAVAEQGQVDLTTAYNTLAGLPCPPANVIVDDLGGTTRTAGVYCSDIGIGVTGPLTLDGGGDPDAVFVFQAGSSLTTAGDILLINGAQAQNVFWQVGSSATLGTASQWQGNILALTSITLVDDANLHGRALARNGAVSLGTNNTITLP